MYTNAKLRERRAQQGFTLIEVMVASFIAVWVFIGLFNAYIYLGRTLTRTSYFQKQTTDSGRMLVQFAKDASAAEKIGGSLAGSEPSGNPTATTLVLKIVKWDRTTSTVTHIPVTYSFTTTGTNPLTYKLTRTENGGTATILFSITVTATQTAPTFAFAYYNTAGTATFASDSIRTVEYSVSFVEGDPNNKTKSIYTMASPRMSLRNKLAWGQ